MLQQKNGRLCCDWPFDVFGKTPSQVIANNHLRQHNFKEFLPQLFGAGIDLWVKPYTACHIAELSHG